MDFLNSQGCSSFPWVVIIVSDFVKSMISKTQTYEDQKDKIPLNQLQQKSQETTKVRNTLKSNIVA